MKGNMLLSFLEAIGEKGAEIGDVFGAIVQSHYGASVWQISKKANELKNKRLQKEKEHILNQRFRTYICRLKKDNLIKERNLENSKSFKLTSRGISRLSALKKDERTDLPVRSYKAQEADKFVIVAFDVPEKERRKRDWLRAALQNLGLTMLQRSVWIGRVKIPGSFLDDLIKLRILDYIEIFEITKSGSLRYIR